MTKNTLIALLASAIVTCAGISTANGATLSEVLNNDGIKVRFFGALPVPKAVSESGFEDVKTYLDSNLKEENSEYGELTSSAIDILCGNKNFIKSFGLLKSGGCKNDSKNASYYISLSIVNIRHDTSTYRHSGIVVHKTVTTVPVYLDVMALTPENELHSIYSQLIIGEVVAQDKTMPTLEMLRAYYKKAYNGALMKHADTAVGNAEMPMEIRTAEVMQISDFSISETGKTKEVIEQEKIGDQELMKQEAMYGIYQSLIKTIIATKTNFIFVMPPKKVAGAHAVARQIGKEIALSAASGRGERPGMPHFEVKGIMIGAERSILEENNVDRALTMKTKIGAAVYFKKDGKSIIAPCGVKEKNDKIAVGIGNKVFREIDGIKTTDSSRGVIMASIYQAIDNLADRLFKNARMSATIEDQGLCG